MRAGGRRRGRIEDGEVVAAVLGEADGQGPVGEEHVVLQAEDPRDLDELGFARNQRARLRQSRHAAGWNGLSGRRVGDLGVGGLGIGGPVRVHGDRVQVPPSGAVACEPELAGGTPERLQDGLLRAAGHEPLAGERAVCGELRRPQLGAVPRHAWVVPAQPGEAPPVRADARGGVEVVSGGDEPRLGRHAGGQADQLVDHLSAGLVPLSHGDQQAAVGGDAPVRVAVAALRRRFRGERPRGGPGGRCVTAGRPQVLPVQPLVGLVAEDDALAAVLAAEGHVHAAAVLVDERPGADARRRDVRDLATRRASDDHVPAVLERPQFRPIQALADALRPADTHAALRDQLRRHRGAPGTVRRDRASFGGRRTSSVRSFAHGLPHNRIGGGAVDPAFRRAACSQAGGGSRVERPSGGPLDSPPPHAVPLATTAGSTPPSARR